MIIKHCSEDILDDIKSTWIMCRINRYRSPTAKCFQLFVHVNGRRMLRQM